VDSSLGPKWEEREVLLQLSPSVKSVAYTAFLFTLGTLLMDLFIPMYMGYLATIAVFISLLILYYRLRPILKIGFKPTSLVFYDRNPRGKQYLLLQFAIALIPLLLLYVMPFLYWLSMVYFLIACWPLANIEFYIALKIIERYKGVTFYRIIRYRKVYDEEFIIAHGYVVKSAKMN